MRSDEATPEVSEDTFERRERMIEFEMALAILEKANATVRELEQTVIALAAELRHNVIVGSDGIAEDWSLNAPEIEGALCKAVERLGAVEQTTMGHAKAA